MHFPKICDGHTQLWQIPGDVASSTQVFLAVTACEVALEPTTLTFVCFPAGHDTLRDQTGNDLEKAMIGKCCCLPTALQQELPKVLLWKQSHPIPTNHPPDKGVSCLQHGGETQV